jgi:hypothetical protein
MLKNVSVAIDDVAFAYNKDRHARIDSIVRSSLLCDFVYEYLADDGVTHGTVIDANVFRLVEQMVASAMIAQYDWDAKLWHERICPETPERAS